MHRKILLTAWFIVTLAFSAKTAAVVTDLSLEILSNEPSFIAPGQRRDLELLIRNNGPELANSVAVVSGGYLISPIGEILVDPPISGISCPLQYTDFVTPSGQTLELFFFAVPPLNPGSEFRCKVSVLALGRGVTFYNLQIGVSDVGAGYIDTNPSNNIASFVFSFVLLTQIPAFSVAGLVILIMAVVALTWSRLK